MEAEEVEAAARALYSRRKAWRTVTARTDSGTCQITEPVPFEEVEPWRRQLHTDAACIALEAADLVRRSKVV